LRGKILVGVKYRGAEGAVSGVGMGREDAVDPDRVFGHTCPIG